jgi:hypothetical protein
MGFDRIAAVKPFERHKISERAEQHSGGRFAGGFEGFDFQVVPRITDPGVSENQTTGDTTFLVKSGATYLTDGQLVPKYNSEPLPVNDILYASADEDIATVDGAGFISYVLGGRVDITATSNQLSVNKTVSPIMAEISGATVSTFVEFAEGSLGRNIEDEVDSRIEGKDPETTGPLFSVLPGNSNYTGATGGTDQFVRNSSCWIGDIDITCISPGFKRPGQTLIRNSPTATLITPCHVIGNTHYRPPNGSTLYFVTMDNTVVTRTIVGSRGYGGYDDLWTGVLDSDVPAGITPSKIAGYAALSDYAYPRAPDGYKLTNAPIVWVDQNEIAGVLEVLVLDKAIRPAIYENIWTGKRTGFYRRPGYLDSSSPGFFIVNGELSLLYTTFYSFLSNYYGSAENILRIQSELNYLSTTFSKPQHALTITDFSGFTNYGA